MAFHFQPSADSSDEGEVDITAWQGGAKKSRASAQPPAPVATTFNTADDEGDDEVDMTTLQQPTAGSSADVGAGDEDDDEPTGLSIDGESKTPQDLSANRTPSPSPEPATVVPSAFTSINQRSDDDESDDVEVSTERSRYKSKTASHVKKGKLVPRVSRAEVDVDEYEDFTKDGEVLLRVKKEIPGKRGRVRYLVELGDYTAREVCCVVPPHAATFAHFHRISGPIPWVSSLSADLNLEVSRRIGFRRCVVTHLAPTAFPTLPCRDRHFTFSQLH